MVATTSRPGSGHPVTQQADQTAVAARGSDGPLASAGRQLRHDYLTLAAATLLLAYAALAVGADLVAGGLVHTTPTTIDMRNTLSPPNPVHWLGTDDFGRDQLVRLLYGARVSLTIGLVAAAVNITVGVALGALAGYFGRRVDDVIVWLINTLRAVPTLFL